MPTYYTLTPKPETVHWGYLDAKLPPRLTVDSGDTVTIETVATGQTRNGRSLLSALHIACFDPA